MVPEMADLRVALGKDKEKAIRNGERSATTEHEKEEKG